MNPQEKGRLGHSRLQVTRLGFGGASIGRNQSFIDVKAVTAAVRTGLKIGINFIDTSPGYGDGKSEETIGLALKDIDRESYVVCTKVGDSFKDTGDPDRRVRDFSREAVLRSHAESLKRLELERVDVLLIHDPHVPVNVYDEALQTAYPTLVDLRASGTVGAIGVGMNDLAMFCRFAKDGEFDCFLVWGLYSLLDQTALDELFPLCQERGISVILGTPYEGGLLASDFNAGAKFRYRDAPSEILTKVRKIKTVCDRYDVPLKAAALQFPFGHPVVATTIPGTRSEERMTENYRMMQYLIPEEFWYELKHEDCIREDTPVPVFE